jgi:hypothetical protein
LPIRESRAPLERERAAHDADARAPVD